VKLLRRIVTAIRLEENESVATRQLRNKFTNILFSAKHFLLDLAGPQVGCILILKCEILRDKYNWQFEILV